MPNVTATPKGQLNGDILTQFTDTTSTASVTYTFPTQQTSIIIENSGVQDIFVTVGSYINQVIKADKKWKVDVSFTSFSIRSDVNSQEFIATAIFKSVEDLASLTSQFADIANLNNFEITNKNRKAKPLVTISIDDGFKQDYTHVMPLLNSKGVVATTGVVTNWIGTTSELMTVEQIKELQDVHGWEIASHSKTHSAQFPTKTDEELTMELKESKEILNSYGLDVNNLLLPFGATDARVQEFCRKYYRATRVSGSGSNGIQNYTPVNMQALSSILFGDAVAGSTTDAESGTIVDSFEYFKYYIDQAKTKNLWLIFIMHSKTMVNNGLLPMLEQIVDYIQSINVDIVTMNEGLNQFGNIVDTFNFKVGADGKIDGQYGKIKMAAENAILNNTPIKEVDTGYITTNVVQAGVAAGFPNNEAGTLITVKPDNYYMGRSFQLYHQFGKNKGFFLRDFDDVSSSNWNRLDNIIIHPDNSILSPHSTSNLSKSKINYCYISPGGAAGYPEDKAGLLIAFPLADNQAAWFEEYKINGTHKKYARYWDSVGVKWSNWQLDNNIIIHPDNFITSAHSYTSLELGKINYCFISAGGASGFPEGKAGLFVGYRIDDNQGVAYEEYNLFESDQIYKRYWKTSTNGWGDWQLQVITTTKPFNSYILSDGISTYPKGVSFCEINTSHATTNGFPENKGGVLETRNILTNGYIHQYYHLYDATVTYKRVYKSDGTWGLFVKSHD